MPEISAIFASFQQGEIRFEELDAALGQILADSPERLEEVQEALRRAKDDGLPWNIYAVLRGNIDLSAGQAGSAQAGGNGGSSAPTEEATREDETIVLGGGEDDPGAERTLFLGGGEQKDSDAGAEITAMDVPTVVLNEENLDGTTAPIRGSLADNAKRLARDRASTEHMLMTYLGEDFVAADSDPVSGGGDIFSQPFTQDEIDDTELSSATEPTQVNAEEGEYAPGYMLRQRFQLLTKLGEGGMGAVWRARDMLKVRARDRNPYVAIKLLTGDFREHPEAFIALQRETSKQQRLAHPNIATVYNFDRDQSTNTVFMTMEVMEGESMDKVIRKLPREGLTVDEAMPIIEQLGAGLSYAHQNGLVHSDLKPGNCFLTRNGVVKLLDFGIARASKTEAHAEGERTLFDPGELGALTPAYATVEMFEGMDPDPSDDIYALAIMSYQLFTGKHPFGKKRADKAMSLGLQVPNVAKLSKKQNRGIARALAFKREDRTASVEDFLRDIRPPKSKKVAYLTGGVAAALIVGALANPIMDLVRARENASIIEQIEGGTPAKLQMGIARIKAIESPTQRRKVLQDQRTFTAMSAVVEQAEGESLDLVLALIARLDADWQQDFFGHPAVRQAILENFRTRIESFFNPAEEKRDYPSAWAEFQKLDALYPNSASVLTIRNTLERNRSNLVADLEDEYERLLKLGAIVPVEGDRDIADVLSDLAGLMPEHALIGDIRLRERVTELAHQFLEAGELEAAQRYIDAGLGYTPDDPKLIRLMARRIALAEQTERESLGAGLRARLESARPALDRLEGFEPIKRDLVTLSVLDPNDAFALSLQQKHQDLFQHRFDEQILAGNLDGASSLLAFSAPLLDGDYLRAARARLAAAKTTAPGDSSPGADQPYRSSLETLTHHVGAAKSGIDWITDSIIGIRAFTAVLPAEDPRLEKLRTDMIQFLLAEADRAVAVERFDSGRLWIARARLVSTSHPGLEEAAAALETAAVETRERRSFERDLATFEQVHDEFSVALSDQRPKEAEKSLRRMREIADSNAGVRGQNVALIRDAYEALGKAYAEKADYESAEKIVTEAIEAGWASNALSDAQTRYREAIDQRALLFALRSRMESAKPLNLESVENDLEILAQQFPDEIAAIRSDLASRRSESIVAYVSAKNFDAAGLNARMREFSRLFPDSVGPLNGAISNAALKRLEAESRRDPASTRRLVDEFRRVLPDNPKFEQIARGLPPTSILSARRHVATGRLTRALATLEADRSNIGKSPEYAALKRTIARKQAQAERKFKVFASRVKTGTFKSREMRVAALEEVKALWSDNPEFNRADYVDREPGACRADLAGEGRLAGGSCYDPMPGGIKGPVLVVVPAADAGGGPYAIGKYEVSVAEFNRYCAATGACAPKSVRNDRVPVTGIPLADARSYADWLSAQATAESNQRIVYRLPTGREWRHAAAAGGDVPSRGINCRPKGGSSLAAGLISGQGGTFSLGMPIGRSLISASFGEANAWGLVNAVGNAREWATAGNGVVARGGAFEDPLESCGVESERAHDGGADAATGFRLVREIR